MVCGVIWCFVVVSVVLWGSVAAFDVLWCFDVLYGVCGGL